MCLSWNLWNIKLDLGQCNWMCKGQRSFKVWLIKLHPCPVCHSSLPSPAPCAAKDVAASLDCYNNTAEVSWTPASGANSYMVTAVVDGHRASCETDGDRCDLMELQCGQMYNVSLTTISDHCQTETQTNVTFNTREFNNILSQRSCTKYNGLIESKFALLYFVNNLMCLICFPGPCKPIRVGVNLQCGTSTANLHWEERNGVELYMATATCSMGMTRQCNSTNSTCQFSNLHCGETYTFSVTAYSHMCYSEVSSTVEIQTGRARYHQIINCVGILPLLKSSQVFIVTYSISADICFEINKH